MSPGAFVWAAALLSAPAPSLGLWLTLEVQNPPALGGHRILHLEDLVGPSRLRLPRLPRPEALLLFTTTADECARPRGLCRRLEARTATLRARGVVVVAVVLTSRERVPIARKTMAAIKTPIVLALDPHHHVERAFGLRGPGRFVVLDAAGVGQPVPGPRLRGGVPLDRDLTRVMETLSLAVSRLEDRDG